MDTFTAIVARDRTFLRNACAHLLTIPDDAEDVAQETLLKAWEHRTQMPADTAGQRRWLHRIARNACVDRNRHEGVLRRILPLVTLPRAAGPAAEAITHLELRDVDAAFGLLPLIDRDALLRNVEQSGKEMAAAMGITAAGTKSRVNRARVRLRAAMVA